ncbi:hypothetical protein TUBRATIS_21800 [Tubulinosema ratisbonensis]|uniref:Uncharacterized protein n=1 Tax=Tubulinosema ratisbonensis TaxID=291195 RepID=A0A437AJT2_9MICR|nr:hypothetical protein TUBRATIS_21800 [Tubulinosema ratisbonensis]
MKIKDTTNIKNKLRQNIKSEPLQQNKCTIVFKLFYLFDSVFMTSIYLYIFFYSKSSPNFIFIFSFIILSFVVSLYKAYKNCESSNKILSFAMIAVSFIVLVTYMQLISMMLMVTINESFYILILLIINFDLTKEFLFSNFLVFLASCCCVAVIILYIYTLLKVSINLKNNKPLIISLETMQNNFICLLGLIYLITIYPLSWLFYDDVIIILGVYIILTILLPNILEKRINKDIKLRENFYILSIYKSSTLLFVLMLSIINLCFQKINVEDIFHEYIFELLLAIRK